MAEALNKKFQTLTDKSAVSYHTTAPYMIMYYNPPGKKLNIHMHTEQCLGITIYLCAVPRSIQAFL